MAGMLVARLPERAIAQRPAPVPTSLNLSALTPDDFPSPNPALPNLATKNLATVDSTQFLYQIGVAPKHTHSESTEVQVFLAGTGTEWLGNKQIDIEPGTFVVIPPNTAHGGFTGGPFRFYTVKTPPQVAGDYHPVP